MVFLRFLFTSAFALLLFSTLGFAKDFTVDPNSDNDCSDSNCDLQSAFNEAASNNQNDHILIKAAANPYFTSGSPFTYQALATENFSLTVEGEGPDATVLDGQKTANLLEFLTASGVLNGGTDDAGHITIQNLGIKNGSNTGSPGGVRILTMHASVVVENCRFESNETVSSNAQFTDVGGGLFIASNGSSNVSLIGNTFLNNVAKTAGGGAYVFLWDGSLVIQDNIFKGNSTLEDSSGGGLYADTLGPLTCTNNYFEDNHSTAGGGASIFAAGMEDISHNIFLQNTASSSSNSGATPYGGGLIFGRIWGVGGENGTISANQFFENTADVGGALGISMETGNLNISENLFVKNLADLQSGAIDAYFSERLTLHHNVFYQNTSQWVAGALTLQPGSSNPATFVPAGFVFNNIFQENTAFLKMNGQPYTDDISLDNANIAVDYTIEVSSNLVRSIDTDCDPNIVDCSKRLIISNTLDPNIDPLFVNPNPDIALADFHLQPGSPCINAGDPLAPHLSLVDFEGDSRTIGAPDLGIDEFLGCGDGVVQSPEQCDDQNSVDDDSCSNACQINAPSSGSASGSGSSSGSGSTGDTSDAGGGCSCTTASHSSSFYSIVSWPIFILGWVLMRRRL